MAQWKVIEALEVGDKVLAALRSDGGVAPRVGALLREPATGSVWEVYGLAHVPIMTIKAGSFGVSLSAVGHTNGLRRGQLLDDNSVPSSTDMEGR